MKEEFSGIFVRKIPHQSEGWEIVSFSDYGLIQKIHGSYLQKDSAENALPRFFHAHKIWLAKQERAKRWI